MKLEQMFSALCDNDSLGENIFHFHLMGQIKKQMNNNVPVFAYLCLSTLNIMEGLEYEIRTRIQIWIS
jgi:hypothetical protein